MADSLFYFYSHIPFLIKFSYRYLAKSRLKEIACCEKAVMCIAYIMCICFLFIISVFFLWSFYWNLISAATLFCSLLCSRSNLLLNFAKTCLTGWDVISRLQIIGLVAKNEYRASATARRSPEGSGIHSFYS